jgi:hypothetical protein
MFFYSSVKGRQSTTTGALEEPRVNLKGHEFQVSAGVLAMSVGTDGQF